MDTDRVWFLVEVFGGIFLAAVLLGLLSMRLQRRHLTGALERFRDKVATTVPEPHEHVLVSADAFPWLDHAWYGEVQRRLEACGYTFAGDVEDRTLTSVFPRYQTFTRVMISRRGQVRAAICEVHPRGFFMPLVALFGLAPRRVRCLELVSEDAEGGAMLTTNAEEDAGALLPLEVERMALGAASTPEDLVRLHRQRLAERSPELAPLLTFDGIDDVIASFQRGESLLTRHRAGQGAPVSEAEMHRIASEKYQKSVELVLEEMHERQLRRG